MEKAIIDALDSPLLYGNDIGKAKRILFNIYSSEEHPIFVREMQEIDDFFDRLDPNIDVIWGTSTDNTLGEDAKVTILATGLEDDLKQEIQKDMRPTGDEVYEEMIPLLYKPMPKNKPLEAPKEEPPFEVEAAPEPEPAPVADTVVAVEAPSDVEETDDVTNNPEKSASAVEKLKAWMTQMMKDIAE